MKALIAAGGSGTRMRPITHTRNKQLIPIANRPMLFHVLDSVAETGIKEVYIVINKGDKNIPAIVKDGAQWGLFVKYIEQHAPLGLAHVVKIARPYIGDDNFIYILGDNILAGGLKKHLETFQRVQSNCHLLLARVRDPERFGVAVVKDNKIVRTVEKPKEFISDLVVTGIYFYDKSIFKAVNAIKPSPVIRDGYRKIAELEITSAHQWLLDNGYTVTYSVITGWWKDTGKPRDLLEGNQLLLTNIEESKIEGEIDKNVIVEGKIIVGKGTRIVNSERESVIRGPLVIGENCNISSSYIGPYTAIGNNVEIYDSEIEHSIVFDDAKVNSAKRIVDSLIGTNAVISSAKKTFPTGHRLIVGDNSVVEL